MKSQSRFLVRFIAGEAAVYDRLSGDTHYLNGLACAIYSLNAKPGGLSLRKLAQCLDCPADERLAADMQSTVKALAALGLIVDRGQCG
ncbi:MAG: HPr-rel-A system PqqD family peptide chaperone [Thiobacillaceae bacterium]